MLFSQFRDVAIPLQLNVEPHTSGTSYDPN